MDDKALVQQDPFQMMERMDEQQVLDEIKGRAIDALVYEIKQGGQSVIGLSLAGVREVARMMNTRGGARIGISDREPAVTETEDYFEVKVFAQDPQNGGGYWGIKRQPKKYANGSDNVFALEQALAKAQRNALRGLIPEYFAKEMIEQFRARGGIKRMQTGQVEQKSIGRQSWETSSALITRIIAEIPYFGGQRTHVINALKKLGEEGKIKLSTSDDEVFAVVDARAKQRADEEANKK